MKYKVQLRADGELIAVKKIYAQSPQEARDKAIMDNDIPLRGKLLTIFIDGKETFANC